MKNDAEQLRAEIFEGNLRSVHVQADRLFFWLLTAEWMLAIALALFISPYGWTGRVRTLHTHVEVAIVLGGLINALPLTLLTVRPGWWVTRQSVAVVQMLWSALLIHLTGGRIETHFHVFGSLAFIAFYRDWRLLPTATLVVAADHVVRGFLWPESVYGIANPEWWRFLEHAGWLTFEDVVLTLACFRQLAEMRLIADREAALEILNADVEGQVEARTAELSVANEALAREMTSRLQTEAELRQAQKLEAVGRLASGVAHEINTPVQFVSDNLYFLREATQDLIGLVGKLHTVQRSALNGTPTREALAEATEAVEAADLPYILENVPIAFDRSVEGLNRVATIVRSMKEFAHPGTKEMTTIDLNRAIECTLAIARHEYKYVADVETDLGQLAPLTCHAGDINQVILNIVVNAAHAIGEVVEGTGDRGRISVRTRLDGDHVVVSIADTGKGIPESIRDRVFEPFFTTKPVGKGTGQGLAIARSVVVDKHGGKLTLESVVGQGTTFHIRLPLAAHDREEMRRVA
jgi:signal transduction histidine kinase